ncbi:MAG TPA: amidase [Thermoanaerobaculia bacterium]
MSEDRDESKRGESKGPGEVSRRDFLRLGAVAGAGVPLAGLVGAAAAQAAQGPPVLSQAAVQLQEATIASLQAAMTRGGVSSQDLVNMYLERISSIDESGPTLNSILKVNPDARRIAKGLDRERKNGQVRGPLHGIPITLKGNIDTGDKMETTAGSLALEGAPALQDATVAARLRAAGAVILAKTNLSEWANFRGFGSVSGWSGQGGQTRNPYILDRDPSGSSSGSAASTSANLAAVGIGTETDGSIISPANVNGVAAIKPTVGLTSRAGVIPISHTQDTVGPHARTVADAATVLGAMVGVDPRDPQTAASAGKFFTDYTQFLDANALHGARIGVLRAGGFTGYDTRVDALFEQALTDMEHAGATLVDPADIPTIEALNSDQAEIIVLIYDFKRDLNAYLATRTGVPVHNMADVIQFDKDHAAQEMWYFGQEFFELAQQEIFSQQDYTDAIERGHRLAGAEGIDAALANNNVVALVAPSGNPAWPIDYVNGDHFTGSSTYPSAVAGYPIVNVPMGFIFDLLPVGISFLGTAWSEPTLIKLAYAYEQATHHRRAPQFLPTFPLPVGEGPFKGSTLSAADRLERSMDRLKISSGLRSLIRNI